jgi:hypothetical protein
MTTQQTLESQDPRSPELVEAHSVLAREAFNTLAAQAAKAAEAHPDEAKHLRSSTGQTYTYPIKLTLGSLLYTVVTIDFAGTDDYFLGHAGGLAVGVDLGWGAAVLNYRVEDIVGWEARFELSFLPLATNINLWGMHGEYIGSGVTGGIGLGSGIVGGQGSFKAYR